MMRMRVRRREAAFCFSSLKKIIGPRSVGMTSRGNVWMF